MKPRWSKTDCYILAALLAVTVLAFWRVLFLRDWSFGVETDFIRQFYPARVHTVNSLAAGSFPLWDPYVLGGRPFFASYQTALLYPVNFAMVGAFALVGASWSIKAQCFFVVLHVYMAGAFTYAAARDCDCGRAGSAAAALTFMFSGFMMAHAGHINQVSGAAWIPLVFFLFNRSVRRRSLPYSVGAGVVVGVALLAGHLQSVFYLCVLLLGLVLFRGFQHHRFEPQNASLVFGAGALALTVATGVGLAAAQLIPTWELIGRSTRNRMPYDIAVMSSLPRREVLTLAFPKFFGGSPETYHVRAGWYFWETYVYSGVVSGALAVVALLRRRRGFVIFLWIAGLVALVLALGPGGYVWTWLFKAGLFVNRFHDPARVMVIFSFVMALAAGLGVSHLLGSYEREGKVAFKGATAFVGALAAGLLALGAALALYLWTKSPPGPGNSRSLRSMVVPLLLILALFAALFLASRLRLKPWLLALALFGLVAVDLVFMNAGWVQVKIDPDDIFGDRAASEFVASRPGLFRVEPDANTMYKSLDNGALYGLEKATGDDSLVLADYDAYREIISPQVGPGVQLGLFYEGAVNSPMLDPLNSVYFMTRNEMHPALFAHGKFELVKSVEGVFVYRNRTALRRAWMSDWASYSNNELVASELRSTKGAGIRETALAVLPSVARESGEGALSVSVKGRVTVTEHSATRIRIATDPSCRGLLVVSEMHYPGWQAYVDGRKTPTLETNLALRGVVLPGGQKKVEFRFEPASVRAGAGVSLVTVALLLLYSGALVLERRRRRPEGKTREALDPDTGP